MKTMFLAAAASAAMLVSATGARANDFPTSADCPNGVRQAPARGSAVGAGSTCNAAPTGAATTIRERIAGRPLLRVATAPVRAVGRLIFGGCGR